MKKMKTGKEIERHRARLTEAATGAAVSTAGAAVKAVRFWESRGPKYLFFFLSAGLLVCAVLSILATIGADPALAQGGPDSTGDGGGGDAIQGTLSNVRDYIAQLLLVLGGIGFVISLGLKAASPINENAQYLANYGMKSSVIAVLAGAIVNPIMEIVEGLASGGGG